MIREQVRSAINGVPLLILGLAGIAASVWLFFASVGRPPRVSGILLAIASVFVSLVRPLRPQDRQPERGARAAAVRQLPRHA